MTTTITTTTINTHLDPSTGAVDAQWCCRDGRLEDPADGLPALVGRRSDGTILEAHYHAGQLDDPDDGSPAWLLRHPDGAVLEARHYHRDRRIS